MNENFGRRFGRLLGALMLSAKLVDAHSQFHQLPVGIVGQFEHEFPPPCCPNLNTPALSDDNFATFVLDQLVASDKTQSHDGPPNMDIDRARKKTDSIRCEET
jgi:hypothetical protein